MKLLTQKELLSRSFQGKSFADSFWKRIQTGGPDACWIWKCGGNQFGYGLVRVRYELWLVHRMAWTLTNGDIPKGKQALHRCDNPPCCNPRHLFLGTDLENRHDAIAKKRWNPFHLSPLRKSQVDQMRSDYKTTGITQKELSVSYGISQGAISRILSNQTWVKDWGITKTI